MAIMNRSMHRLAPLAFLLALAAALQTSAATVKIDPAPPGEELSKAFTVEVEGKPCPVYIAKVAPRDPKKRWLAMDDKKNSADYFETAAFATFDMDGPVRVKVICPEEIRSIKVLPTHSRVVPAVEGRAASFALPGPRQLTVEVNGDWVGSLHLFANPPEVDVPKPGDPDVIYFGPGIHQVQRLVIDDGKTVYVAGGAVVRCGIGPDEKYGISSYSGLRNYAPTFELRGKKITFRGRGIIDSSACPTHARNPFLVRGEDIAIEGVIIRDSSTWNIPIRKSDRVTVRNVKILGYRANSDGIDICNSRDVTVEDCFIRTLDDLIVVKSDKDAGPARGIVARRCVLWNEVAHALSVGAELCEDVDNVRFEDSDVIHDKGREWTLRVYHCDSARVTNVRFERLRIEETQRFISLWIGKAVWTRDAERGHIAEVKFEDIAALGDAPRVELTGFDERHAVEDVSFQNVTVNGKPIAPADLKSNPFVRKVTVKP
jgi:glycosyl hydrolase family 28